MSMVTARFDEDEMLQMLSELLHPEESIRAALYCTFIETSLFSRKSIVPGYVAITDKNRLIGYKIDILATHSVMLDMEYLTKIRITDQIFSNKTVYLCVNDDGKRKIKFQYVPKVTGSQTKFPNQEKNSEIMLEELRAIESRLKLWKE